MPTNKSISSTIEQLSNYHNAYLRGKNIVQDEEYDRLFDEQSEEIQKLMDRIDQKMTINE